MRTKLWIAALAALGLAGPLGAHATNPEPMGSDEQSLAKIARARAKSVGMRQTKTQAKNDGSCDLNVGNTVNNRPGNGPREIIVVVQGDVISANNKCK